MSVVVYDDGGSYGGGSGGGNCQGCETLEHKVTSWSATPSDEHYPSEKLVKTSIDQKASLHHSHQVADIDGLIVDGDGSKYLTDAGDYREVTLGEMQEITLRCSKAFSIEEQAPAKGGRAFANAQYNSDNAPAKAFDGDTNRYGWGNNNRTPCWLMWDFGAGNEQVVSIYKMLRSPNQVGGWNSNNYSPRDWRFEGSQDGHRWVLLDRRRREIIRTNRTWKGYKFENAQAFRFYRIYIESANGSRWCNITEMKLLNATSQSCAQNKKAILRVIKDIDNRLKLQATFLPSNITRTITQE